MLRFAAVAKNIDRMVSAQLICFSDPERVGRVFMVG